MRFPWKLCVVTLAVLAGSLAARGAETSATRLVFPPGFAARPHPRLSITTEALARANERAARLPWARECIANLLSEADDVLTEPISIPSIGGQWGMHYVCKDCNTTLTHKLGRHICTACGKEYTGWPYDDVVAGAQHSDNIHEMRVCAIAYALTGKSAYASRARDFLLGYADRYTSYPIHDITNAPAKRGGRLDAQTLGESSKAITFSLAYDLVYNAPGMTAADRAHVEKDLLRELAATIRKNDAGVSNWQAWHNAGIASVAFCLGDEAMAREAIEGKSGFFFQMKNSVLRDGFWCEGSPTYHAFALSALRWTAEFALAAGIRELNDHPRYRAMYSAPIDYTFPDLYFPTVNDAGSVRLAREAGNYELAYARFKDPRFGSVAALDDRSCIEALFWGEDSLPPPAGTSGPLCEKSVDFPGVGATMLRAGKGTDQLCAHLHYGPDGGYHGHPDKLGLIVYGLGRVLVADAATISYSLPLYKGWYKTTLAHNTLVMDGQNQLPAEGELLGLEEKDGVASAQVACSTAYPGVSLSRTIAVTPDYLVDVMTAETTAPHTFDLAFHLPGKPGSKLGFTSTSLAEETSGYQVLHDVQGARTDEMWNIDFVSQESGVRLLSTAAQDTSVILANGWMSRSPTTCPAVLVRRRGDHAMYVSVLEPFRSKPTIESITAVADDDPVSSGVVVSLLRNDGTKDMLRLRTGRTGPVARAHQRTD